MFVYTPTSSSTYSSPTLYPLSHYVAAPLPVPTARERYLRAVAEERVARARYMSELEEQRILASLRQQEALRQAEFRQHQIFAAQNDIARHRVGRIYADNLCRPVASLQGRRQAFIRQHGGHYFPTQRPRSPLNDLEALVSALFQDEVDEGCITKRQEERARAEKASKADTLNARVRLAGSLERAFEATQCNRDIHACRPLGKATAATLPDSTRVAWSRPTETPRNGLARDHAARTIQQRWRSRSVNAVARNDAVATIATLRARFQFLNDTFSFPEHLEFREHVAGQEQETPPLLFTPANAAVHAYIHELTKLLTLADAVSSHGSDQVREARRSFVRLVEEALDKVDGRVAKVWGKRTEDSTSSSVDALETFTTVPVKEIQPTSDSVEHDVSLPGIDSTVADFESMASDRGSDGSNAATIIPHTTTNLKTRTFGNSPTSELRPQDVLSEHGVSLPTSEEAAHTPDATTNLKPRTFENSLTSELRPQDEPSEHSASLATPQEAIHSPGDTTPADSGREDHYVPAPVQFRNGNPEEASPEDLSSASSLNSPLSQSRGTSAAADNEVTGDDVILTREEATIMFAPGLTRAEPFDVVYPDSPSSSSIAVEGNAEFKGPGQDPSVLAENGVPELRGTGNEAQNYLMRDVEEEGFEFL